MAFSFGWNLSTFSFLVGAFAPTVAIVLAAFAERRRRHLKGVKPPQKEKLLRPAGYSLMVELDTLNERMLPLFGLAFLFCAVTGLQIPLVTKVLAGRFPIQITALALSFPTITAVVGVTFTILVFRIMAKAQHVKLGLRGEQAAAEALHEAADAGYRAFHDIQTDEVGNIDHVVVGSKGVFLIETKARCRRGRNAGIGLEAHEVRVKGNSLVFPFARNNAAIPQAQNNARWLSKLVTKKTAERTWVEPIIVLPGWCVYDDGTGPVRAMTCGDLVDFLRSQPERLSPEQVKRVIALLEEKNRTIEFA